MNVVISWCHVYGQIYSSTCTTIVWENNESI